MDKSNTVIAENLFLWWKIMMLLCGAYRFTRRQCCSFYAGKLLYIGVSIDWKREEISKRLENFLGEGWNTDAYIANFVSILKATWICLLDRSGVPQCFWSFLVQLRQDNNLKFLMSVTDLVTRNLKWNSSLVSARIPVIASPNTVPARVTSKRLGVLTLRFCVCYLEGTWLQIKYFVVIIFLLVLIFRWCFASIETCYHFCNLTL
jgi:hypothetical protein